MKTSPRQHLHLSQRQRASTIHNAGKAKISEGKLGKDACLRRMVTVSSVHTVCFSQQVLRRVAHMSASDGAINRTQTESIDRQSLLVLDTLHSVRH